MSATGGQGHREEDRARETWTIYVCEKCGKPHQNTIGGCIVEFDSAGDTRAELQPVCVVSLDAAVAAIIERYCDTSQGLLCSDFRRAADFLREEFGSSSVSQGPENQG